MLILFFKGFLIGIGKIIPGVSGSVLAVSMGVYEPALEKIATFRQKPFQNFLFLAPLACGVFLAILLFSSAILFFMQNHRLLTMCFFFGLLLGTIPSLLKEKVTFHWNDCFFVFLCFALLFLGMNQVLFPEFVVTSNLSYFWVFFLGMIDALSMILPGLSGTALFLALGSYTYILTLFSNPFQDLFASLSFALGFFLCFLFLTKVLHYCFRMHAHGTWIFIFTLILFSLFEFVIQIPFQFQFTVLLQSLFVFLLGFLLVQFLPDK